MTLRDTTVTLTGLELVRVLRAFSSARCGAAGVGDTPAFDAAVEARLWETDEAAFAALAATKEASGRLRGELCSLAAAKAFAQAVLAGEPVFTPQDG